MLRHVTADEAFAFERQLEHTEQVIKDADEVITAISHSVATTTRSEEYGDQLDVTYSVVILSRKITEIGKRPPTPAQKAEKRREEMGDPHDYVGEP